MNPQEWSIATPEGEATLEAVARLGRLDALHGILRSCRLVMFQPKLRDVVASFEWSAMVKTVREFGANERTIVNIVTSILQDETDHTRIASLLQAIPTVKPDDRRPLFFRPTPGEFARVLHLAHRVSSACFHSLVDTDDTARLVCLVAPSLRRFAEQLDPTACPADVIAALRFVLETVTARVVDMRDAKLTHTKLLCPTHSECCTVCGKLAVFVAASAIPTTTISAHKVQHVRTCVAMAGLTTHVVITRPVDARHDKAKLTKTSDDPMYTRGGQEVDALQGLLMRLTRS